MCIYACVDTQKLIHIHNTHIHVYVYIHTCMFIRENINIPIYCTHNYIHVCMYISLYTCMHVCVYITRVHKLTHILHIKTDFFGFTENCACEQIKERTCTYIILYSHAQPPHVHIWSQTNACSSTRKHMHPLAYAHVITRKNMRTRTYKCMHIAHMNSRAMFYTRQAPHHVRAYTFRKEISPKTVARACKKKARTCECV